MSDSKSTMNLTAAETTISYNHESNIDIISNTDHQDTFLQIPSSKTHDFITSTSTDNHSFISNISNSSKKSYRNNGAKKPTSLRSIALTATNNNKDITDKASSIDSHAEPHFAGAEIIRV